MEEKWENQELKGFLDWGNRKRTKWHVLTKGKEASEKTAGSHL